MTDERAPGATVALELRDPDRWLPWLVRVVWVTLPFTAGPLFGDALDGTSRPVQLTATLGLWVLWLAGLATTAVPHTLTLTAFRIVAPASFAGAVWATLADGASGTAALALGATAAAAVLSILPELGAWFVNGTSYGDERRVPLRPPGALLVGPIPIAWVVVVAGVVAGPMLLAARQWIVGVVVTAVGFAAAARAVKSLHVLSRRWLVFVPAGVVVHDQLTVAEPVLFKRSAVSHFGPALVDSTATDLTFGAVGLALELALDRPVELAIREGRAPEAKVVELDAVLVSVARPALVLDEARRRRINVG